MLFCLPTFLVEILWSLRWSIQKRHFLLHTTVCRTHANVAAVAPHGPFSRPLFATYALYPSVQAPRDHALAACHCPPCCPCRQSSKPPGTACPFPCLFSPPSRFARYVQPIMHLAGVGAMSSQYGRCRDDFPWTIVHEVRKPMEYRCQDFRL